MTLSRCTSAIATALLGCLFVSAANGSQDSAQESAWGSPLAGLEIRIVPPHASLVSTASMDIQILVKNVSGSQSVIRRPNVNDRYDIMVFEAGKKIETRTDKKLAGGSFSGPLDAKLADGDMYSDEVELSAIYALKPGTYTVTASIPVGVFKPGITGTLVSPIVTITVQ